MKNRLVIALYLVLTSSLVFAATADISYPKNLDQFFIIKNSTLKSGGSSQRFRTFEMTYQVTRACNKLSFGIYYEDKNGVRSSTGNGLMDFVEVTNPRVGQKFVRDVFIDHFNDGTVSIAQVRCFQDGRIVLTPENIGSGASAPATPEQPAPSNESTKSANPLADLVNGLLK